MGNTKLLADFRYFCWYLLVLLLVFLFVYLLVLVGTCRYTEGILLVHLRYSEFVLGTLLLKTLIADNVLRRCPSCFLSLIFKLNNIEIDKSKSNYRQCSEEVAQLQRKQKKLIQSLGHWWEGFHHNDHCI